MAAEQIGDTPTNQVILLIDELESHLHPKWQRAILPSLLKLAKVLHSKAQIQVTTATHSPLVMASAETTFDTRDHELSQRSGCSPAALRVKQG